MRNLLLLLAAVVLMASCSAPKYTYNFDYYNYNAEKKKSATVMTLSSVDGPQTIQPEMLTASASEAETLALAPIVESKKTVVKKTYALMTKAERKELRTYLKAEGKSFFKAKEVKIKTATSSNNMDGDLKLAVIFGAVGVVGLIIGGDVFGIIGGIALLIGVVFFVKWVIRQ